jgi:hypothetical protein
MTNDEIRMKKQFSLRHSDFVVDSSSGEKAGPQILLEAQSFSNVPSANPVQGS